MKPFPWLKRKKTAPEIPYTTPIWLGPQSNGEVFFCETKRDRLIKKMILEKGAEHARKLGMDRRHFMASAMGMCTSLWVLNYVAGCSSSDSPGATGGKGGAGGGDGGGGGGYCVPPEAMFDETCATAVISNAGQFVFDIQTHWFNKADLTNFSAYLTAFPGLFDLANEDYYIQNMFCGSDTTIACLTSWPGITCSATRRVGCGMPLSNDHMWQSRDKINELSNNTQRIINHVQILPQDPSGIDVQLEIMHEFYCQHGAGAWKLYPGFKPGFRLGDANGEAVIEKGLEIGLPVFAIHKGLPIGNFFDVTTNYPDDVGPAAAKYPDAKFIIYHSGICSGTEPCSSIEGPYDPNETNPTGVNALIRSILDAKLEPGGNVYGETGSAFSRVSRDPVQAQHFFGKLMKYLGTDNVCWGTDCVISGSPQSQIEAFRALEMSQEFQDMYGYPPLGNATTEGKLNQDKILGLNSAKVYGVDAEKTRCQVSSCPMTDIKRHFDEELGPRRWAFDPPNGPKTMEEWLEGAKEMELTRRPG